MMTTTPQVTLVEREVAFFQLGLHQVDDDCLVLPEENPLPHEVWSNLPKVCVPKANDQTDALNPRLLQFLIFLFCLSPFSLQTSKRTNQ
jgi:hypothetical protein